MLLNVVFIFRLIFKSPSITRHQIGIQLINSENKRIKVCLLTKVSFNTNCLVLMVNYSATVMECTTERNLGCALHFCYDYQCHIPLIRKQSDSLAPLNQQQNSLSCSSGALMDFGGSEACCQDVHSGSTRTATKGPLTLHLALELQRAHTVHSELRRAVGCNRVQRTASVPRTFIPSIMDVLSRLVLAQARSDECLPRSHISSNN